MPEFVIRAENIGKKFCRDLKKSLWYGVQDSLNDLIGRNAHSELRPQEFWANHGISFSLERGQSLGLIGRNGAGKTTLLKTLSGLIKPDIGAITMRGNVGALIALGAGFNPVLTARENIYVNASILGLSKAETDRRLDEIIDFSGVEEFIDSPVRSFSSGMQVRLGFAVASCIRPDILLIDEVLAVGDADFRVKCHKRIREVLKNGCVVILVSHNLSDIANVCSEALWLENGREKLTGKSIDVLQAYTNAGSANLSRVDLRQNTAGSGKIAEVVAVEVSSDTGEASIRINTGVHIKFDVRCRQSELKLGVTVEVKDSDGLIVFHRGTQLTPDSDNRIGMYSIRAGVPPHLLNSGRYTVSIIIGESGIVLDSVHDIVSFDVQVGEGYRRLPGIIAPEITWAHQYIGEQS